MRIRKLLFLLPFCILMIVLFFKEDNKTVEVKPTAESLAPINAVPDKLPEGDTFSIVAIDPVTGEVGGAGASCVDISTTYPRGVTFLSDLILDSNGDILGGIHSQAAYRVENQETVRARMLAGDTPQEILNFVYTNDQGSGTAEDRQYGVVDMIGGPGNAVRTAGFTGNTNSDYKNHIVGPNYSIQGNIILNQDVLDDMETAFVNTNGSLAEKLMAALQGAKRVGADSRCAGVGKSSLSSFVKVLRPGELSPSLDIYAGNTPNNVDPIDILQVEFDEYINNQARECSNTIASFPYTESFEIDFGLWSQNSNNEVDWTRHSNTTASSLTGPSSATDGSMYLYTEASGTAGSPTKRSIIKTPCFDVPVNHSASVSLDYHMYGRNIGTLTIRANNGNGWKPVFVKQGNQGDLWNTATIDLSIFAGSTIQLEVDSVTGERSTNNTFGYEGDLAIDNFSFSVTDLTQVFSFDNETWSPNAPSLVSNLADEYDGIDIVSGSPTLQGDVTVGDITIASGATLNIGEVTLNVSGAIENNGTLNPVGGTLNMIGNEDQSISGNPISLQAFQLNHTGTVSLDTQLSVTQTMTLNSGTVETNNNLTFPDTYDDATGLHTTGQLGEVTGGTIVGNVNVERYVPARRAFRFLSSSVTTTSTIRENWQENGSNTAGFGTHITGAGGASNGFDPTGTNNPSLLRFNVEDQSYDAVTNTDVNTLDAGKDYVMIFRGDRSISLATNMPTPTPTLLRSTGALHTGNFTVPVLSNLAGGSTLIANPYQAAVDMEELLASGTNINQRYFHVWDPNQNIRGAFVTVDALNNSNNFPPNVSQADKFLQPHQSVFINTLANGDVNLIFTEAHKDTSYSGTDVFFAKPSETILQLSLTNQDQSIVYDATRILCLEEGNNSIDSDDAIKNSNQDENLASLVEDRQFSIQERAMPIGEDVIPLHFSNYRGTTYSLTVSIENLVTAEAVLYDSYLDIETPLNPNGETFISFSVDDALAESVNANRFSILFKQEVLSNSDILDVDSFKIYPNPVKNQLNIHSHIDNQLSSITIVDLRGRNVMIENFTVGTEDVSLDISRMSRGLYILRLEDVNGNTAEMKILFD